MSAESLARHFDSVSICLSKGLGAPVGSVLCGPRELIDRARRWRKMLGGGMRQAGMLAAAGIHALEHHVDRLAEDHDNAAHLAEGLGRIDGIEVVYAASQTNMVFVRGRSERGRRRIAELPNELEERGILVSPGTTLRLVTHLDVDRPALETFVEVFAELIEA